VPLFLTIEGVICSHTRMGGIDSMAGSGDTKGQFRFSLRSLGIECSVERFTVSASAPTQPSELSLPLAVGHILYSNLWLARERQIGLDFTVTGVNFGALIELSSRADHLPHIELLDVSVDINPLDLAFSVRNVPIPLPGADLLTNTAVGFLMTGWGMAKALDFSGLLASIVTIAVKEGLSTQVHPFPTALFLTWIS